MSARLVLYFTATEHVLYRSSRGALEPEARFAADDAGLAEFRQYLKRHREALVHVVADLAGEDFHEDQIPYLRGGDRQAVIQRRIAQRYRDTRLAAALSIGYIQEERRSERLLLASFTNTQQFTAWLDALTEANAKLSGVYSAPLLAPALAARLGVKSGYCFVVSANRAGLRQCFVEDGRLRFARLERIGELAPAALAAFVRAETLRLHQYLSTLRALPREGPPVQVIAIAAEGARAAFEQALASDARLAFHTVGLEEAARKVGLRHAPAGAGAEQIYLHLAARHSPVEQFARSEDRRSFVLWRAQRAIVAAGALGFAACAGYAGLDWLEFSRARGGVQTLRDEARRAQQQYERITAGFPVTQTTTENLKATVLEFGSIASRTAAPEAAFAYLSRALEQFPQIELDALTWSVGKPLAASEPKGAAAPVSKPAAAGAEGAQLLEISGRVHAAQRSDYRAITAEVQRFAALLRADPAWQVVRTQLPFDVTPEGTLSGDIGAGPETGEAPRFVITIARALK
jgi:hypothetical protein